MLNNFFIALERQNLQNESLSDLYTDDNKSKYSSYLRRFYEFWKFFMKNFTARRQLPKLLLMAFFSKSPYRKKISNEQFNLCEAKISLDEII